MNQNPKLSEIVILAKRIAKGRNYDSAATKALKRFGFRQPKNTVGESYVVNDIGAEKFRSLLSAVTAELGKQGAEVAALHRSGMGKLVLR